MVIADETATVPASSDTESDRQPSQETPVPQTAAELQAPSNLRIEGLATTRVVKLKWDVVPGATGYVIYRIHSEEGTTDSDPRSSGLPLGDVLDASQPVFEDRLNLVRGKFEYAVVATLNGEESNHVSRLETDVFEAIPISEAQKLRADAKEGDTIRLAAHPFGTDYLGRDLLARLMSGARVSLFIGFFAPLLYILLGILIGGISGYHGGKLDLTLMRITDLVIALPFLLFMILFRIAFGVGPGESGVIPLIIALVALSWTCSARLVRGQVLQLRESEYVQAARLMGARPLYLLSRHLVPNTMGVILVSFTFAVPSTIFTEAFLSFIGMGVVPPTPSWGSMCNDGIQSFLTHPHEFLFPALFISVAVLAFNLLGDGLRDALDPKLRSAE